MNSVIIEFVFEILLSSKINQLIFYELWRNDAYLNMMLIKLLLWTENLQNTKARIKTKHKFDSFGFTKTIEKTNWWGKKSVYVNEN